MILLDFMLFVSDFQGYDLKSRFNVKINIKGPKICPKKSKSSQTSKGGKKREEKSRFVKK